MDKKFYTFYCECPYCNKFELTETGYSKNGSLILRCNNCTLIMLERDIITLQNRKELNEDHKVRKSDN